MRIVIDMQGAQTESRFRGIGRYTMSLALALARQRGTHEILLALNGSFPDSIDSVRDAFDGVLPQESIHVWNVPCPISDSNPDNEQRRIVAELIREAFLLSMRPDIILVSSFFEGYLDDAVTSIGRFDTQTPVAVLLYDLIPLLNPDHYLRPSPAYEKHYRRKFASLERASLLLAISESTRQEGISNIGASERLVVNVSAAADSIFVPGIVSSECARNLQEKFGVAADFVLYTGGADERKNLRRLLQAYATLPKQMRGKYQLVIAGRMPEAEVLCLKDAAEKFGLRKQDVCFTGYVSDEELVVLYRLCHLFVFPSWHEGFGLPALEAMACGAAVIGSDSTSIAEVIAFSDAQFDPLDVSQMATLLERVLTDKKFRSELAQHGLERAKQFSWEESARRTLTAFENLSHKNARMASSVRLDAVKANLIEEVATAYVKFEDGSVDLPQVAHAISRIPNPGCQRQLLVDISELVHRDARTGVQRVTRSILAELLKNPPEDYVVTPVYGSSTHEGYRYAHSFIGQFNAEECSGKNDYLIDYQPGDCFLGLDLQHHVAITQNAYLQGLRRHGVKVIFVVYDLLPVLLPWAFPPGTESGHARWLDIICGYDGAMCISRAVADELTAWRDSHAHKREREFDIGWFHLGADLESSKPSKGLPENAREILRKLSNGLTFLAVGTVEPRKRHEQILAAFELLWASGVEAKLAIIGKPGWMVDRLVSRMREHPENGGRLFWLEGISDEYLEQVYSASTCLIAASSGEGFGLPLIEAAQYEIPIIARDIPVFREVAGDCACYFHGDEPRDLAEAVTRWIELYKKSGHPRSADMPWLTWSKSARQLLDALKLCGTTRLD